jgi:hypothetical protein
MLRLVCTNTSCRYNLREPNFAPKLAKYFKQKPDKFDGWSKSELGQVDGRTGCLGYEVEQWMDRRAMYEPRRTEEMTLGRRVSVPSLRDSRALTSLSGTERTSCSMSSLRCPNGPQQKVTAFALSLTRRQLLRSTDSASTSLPAS